MVQTGFEKQCSSNLICHRDSMNHSGGKTSKRTTVGGSEKKWDGVRIAATFTCMLVRVWIMESTIGHFEMGFLARVNHVDHSAKKSINKRAEDRAADLQRVVHGQYNHAVLGDCC